MIELYGIIASVFVIASMSFNSTSTKANVLMRVLNTIGCLFFVYYGLKLPAYSTAFMNAVAGIVNIIQMIKLYKGGDK